MSQFVYLYRIPPTGPVSPEQMEQRMKGWMAWMKDLEGRGHLVAGGHPLERSGAVVKDAKGSVSDGPYAETKDIIMGFSVVEAKDLKEAIALSTSNPMLQGGGGLIEVRPVASM